MTQQKQLLPSMAWSTWREGKTSISIPYLHCAVHMSIFLLLDRININPGMVVCASFL